MTLWEDVKKNLSEWYTVTSEKTSEVAKITTRRYDKFGISRDIERQFSELGNVVYTGMKEDRPDLLSEPAVTALMGRIEALETELRDKDLEIEKIREEFSHRKSRAAAAGGTDATAGDDDAHEPGSPESVLTDPILEEGGSDSAILLEMAEAGELDPDGSAGSEPGADGEIPKE